MQSSIEFQEAPHLKKMHAMKMQLIEWPLHANKSIAHAINTFNAHN